MSKKRRQRHLDRAAKRRAKRKQRTAGRRAPKPTTSPAAAPAPAPTRTTRTSLYTPAPAPRTTRFVPLTDEERAENRAKAEALLEAFLGKLQRSIEAIKGLIAKARTRSGELEGWDLEDVEDLIPDLEGALKTLTDCCAGAEDVRRAIESPDRVKSPSRVIESWQLRLDWEAVDHVLEGASPLDHSPVLQAEATRVINDLMSVAHEDEGEISWLARLSLPGVGREVFER